MADTTDLSKGSVIRYNGKLWRIIDLEHRTPGNWRAMFMVRMKNIETGEVVPERFNAGTSIDLVRTETRTAQYLYKDGDTYHFMDNESYDQLEVREEQLEETVMKFMRENDEMMLFYADEKLITVDFPSPFVALKITSTETAVRGDTATNVDKPATVETGAVVRVPAFVKEGDTIRIDTRTGQYMERVTK